MLTKADQRPNIIFILCDDLGWQDVGYMGSQYFETPTIDKLAKEGFVFKQAYMYPSCSPSRTAILTGKHSFRTGVYRVPVLESGKRDENIYSRWTVEKKHPFYSEYIQKAGYKTIHLGKWHVVGPNPMKELKQSYPFTSHIGQPAGGDLSWINMHMTPEVQEYYPTGRGFDENVGGTWWGDPARGYERGYKDLSGGYKAPFKNPFIPEKSDDEWLTDRLTEEAIDFMKRNSDQPFFVNPHYYASHRPSIAYSEESLEKYKNKPECPVTGQSAKSTEEIIAYATMVERIDYNVQRIVDYLDESGLRENTIIFFTSDNGFNKFQSFNKNLKGAKMSEFEGGLRVPAFANWPQKVLPGETNTPIMCMDYYPTFLELTGVFDFDGPLDGVSLLPLIFETGELDRNPPIYWHLPNSNYCTVMRKGDWKLIQYFDNPDHYLLYNLKDDLGEKTNLADQYPKKAKALLREMTAWRKKNKVPLPPATKIPF